MPTSLTPAEARRRRKDLEPLRRLSKTTGSLDLSAFRVAVPSTEVTNSCPACNRSGGSCTHGAPRPGPIPERTADHADSPHCNGGPRTCSRSAGVGRASTSDQCDGSRCMRCRGAGSDRSLVTVPSSDARGVTASNGRAVHVAIGFAYGCLRPTSLVATGADRVLRWTLRRRRSSQGTARRPADTRLPKSELRIGL